MLANIGRLEQHMRGAELDALVATSAENVYYLTGIGSITLEMFPHVGHSSALLTAEDLGKVHAVWFRGDIDQLLNTPGYVSSYFPYGTFYREAPPEVALTNEEIQLKEIAVDSRGEDSAVAALKAAIKSAGVLGHRIGVDETGISAEFYGLLSTQLHGTELIPAGNLLRSIRKVKTEEEIDRLTRSAEVAETGILAAVSAIADGTTEGELVSEFEKAVVAFGARPKFTLIKVGRGGVAGQAAPRDVGIRRGDTVWFDVGLIHNGYWADIARVFSFGEPADRAVEAYGAMLSGEEFALRNTRAGMSGGEIFDSTVTAVREAGVPGYRRHHVGHGIGVEVYDQVLLTPGNRDVVEEGTVVNIETPYYEFGLGAVHVEDPFVVQADGNRLLTKLSRELTVVD